MSTEVCNARERLFRRPAERARGDDREKYCNEYKFQGTVAIVGRKTQMSFDKVHRRSAVVMYPMQHRGTLTLFGKLLWFLVFLVGAAPDRVPSPSGGQGVVGSNPASLNASAGVDAGIVAANFSTGLFDW